MKARLALSVIVVFVLCACQGPPAWGSKCVRGLAGRGVTYFMAISPDGSKLLVTYGEGFTTATRQVVLYDLAGGSVTRAATFDGRSNDWPPKPLGDLFGADMEWRDNTRLNVLSEGDGIYEWYPDTNTLSKVFDCPHCDSFSMSPDNLLALSIFGSQMSHIEVWDPGGMTQLADISLPRKQMLLPRWSPNGGRLAIVVRESPDINPVYVWSRGDTVARRVGVEKDAMTRQGPVWLDNEWIMINDREGVSWSKINVDTGQRQQLAKLQPPDSDNNRIFEFVANGTLARIAFTVTSGLYVLDVPCAIVKLPGA